MEEKLIAVLAQHASKLQKKRDALISQFTDVAPFFSHGFCGKLKVHGCGKDSNKWLVSSINGYFTIEFDGNRSDFHEFELDELYSLSGLEARDAVAESDKEIAMLQKKNEELFNECVHRQRAKGAGNSLYDLIILAHEKGVPMITKSYMLLNGRPDQIPVYTWASTTHENPISHIIDLLEQRNAERAKSAAKDDEIEAIKAENKRLRDALLDIEDDANAKAVLGESLNTKSILMSARHGLGLAGMEVNRD